MTRFGWAVVLGIIALCVIAGGVFMWRNVDKWAAPPPAAVATTTPVVDPSELAIYTSGEYGFSFFYPANATVTDAYSKAAGQPLPWRNQAVGTGTPIVRIKAGGGEIRVGASTDKDELDACRIASPAEDAQKDMTVGSTTWSTFTFDKLGTDDEERITSYRTLHDKRCYAVEIFQPLSETATSTGYTINDTITSFSFAQ